MSTEPNGQRPTVIEVKDLRKSFRLPSHQIDTLKERMLHPFSRAEFTELKALRDISFSVRQGEMLGIAGRNGSGKTTLLKLLASIYRADGGSIRIAGKLAPFIELGVGFNLNLTARDNVLLNGVMMGLTPGEARRRFDEVIEFAELEEFVELKLKNYSSGMAMRLAFSVMVQSAAEVMLVDEVLAVGDASFAQKCVDSFKRLRREGCTILFVTHDMESMRSLCDHAILIEDGLIDTAGDPDEVARRYFQINFTRLAGVVPAQSQESALAETQGGRILDVWLENGAGERDPQHFVSGEPLHLVAELVTDREIDRPVFSFEICSPDGACIFSAPLQPLGGADEKLATGRRVGFRATVSNALVPGSYVVNWGFSQHGMPFDLLDLRRGTKLEVRGEKRLGFVELDWRPQVVAIDDDDSRTARP
jgi:ABC-type polysaccharide/polyol phosphate transport system ATPase subunit